jgi:hypothetical protein
MLNNILCIESFEIKIAEHHRLDQLLIRNKYITREDRSRLTIDDIRDFLKELKLTIKYNRHAPKLLYLYSGEKPVYFTEDEKRIIIDFYTEIDQIIHEKNDDKKPYDINNTPFGPYFILRIIKHLWGNDPEKMRIRKFIFLKEIKTVMKYDLLWKYICEKRNPPMKYEALAFFDT